MWGSREKNWGKKSMKNFRPRRKKSKNVKKYYFPNSPVLRNWSHFWEFLAIFHTSSVCEGVWKIAKPAFVPQNLGAQRKQRPLLCLCLIRRLCNHYQTQDEEMSICSTYLERSSFAFPDFSGWFHRRLHKYPPSWWWNRTFLNMGLSPLSPFWTMLKNAKNWHTRCTRW